MTKTLATALVAFAALAGAASANTSPTALQNDLRAYPVQINVSDLTANEQAQVAALISSGDSQAEIVRGLKSIAK
ncbi:hypothetical protein [Actibacterium sp. 188UL27-1]|uniref:hypothetical protein n=1 Tax=Actibacterium sp. 188UL27-1 TaxID=2786961 RepID=UPI00195656E3|nr:hypothetical protein [Actibacterium sp. 188UL27-1]MBM7069532.1 hypothetical protein [Actibacterium sp. 188UL27-1]